MLKFFTLVIFSVIVSIFSLFVCTRTLKAQEILFQDNFNDGDANGWDVITQSGSGTWNVSNQQYGIHLDPGLSNSVPNDSLWNPNWKNIRYELDLRGVYGTDKNILLKFQDQNNFVELHHAGGWINLEKIINGVSRWQGSGHYPLENGQTYHFRIDMQGNYVRVYVNDNLIIESEDITPDYSSWKIGVRAGTGAVRPTEVWYDNIKVTELPPPTPTPEPTPTPIPLPSLDVPDIKQYSDPWGTQIYDNSTIWSSNPLISRWGCALTSAVMVLRYHGHDVTPDSLNNWLNNQPDGYLRNGLVNWLAITRYSLEHSNASIPALEYRRLSGTSDNLISELTDGKPAILSEPGHFIVAKSQMADSFGINDPAYEDRTTLASYSNSFNNIGSYRPTHTDLSYILVTVPEDINISVLDPNGNQIDGYTYTDGPIIDPVDGSSNGPTLKTFMFPVPEDGEYHIGISGEGNYLLNSYLYNKSGQVTTFSKNGVVTTGETDEFTITIGSNNQTGANMTLGGIANDIETLYSNGSIKWKFFYNLLKRKLALIEWAIGKNTKIASQMLRAMYIELKVANPNFISYEAKAVLLEDVSALQVQLHLQ